ncbi:hypothetical protein EI555_012482, partial [Monodon monoceros]
SKISQFYQKFPQYTQALYQGPTLTYPWVQVKRSAEPFIPTVENSKKTVDMDKINQYYQKLTWPQNLKTISQYQKTMKPWNHVKTNVIPYL